MPRAFHPQTWCIFYFVLPDENVPQEPYHIFYNNSSPGKILASQSVSFISLGENQLMSQSNGSLLLGNNIRLVSNFRIVSNIRLVSNMGLVGKTWLLHQVPSRLYNRMETWVTTYISSIKGVLLS